MTAPLIWDRVWGMQVRGVVIHGDGFGKTLGFPTANIDRDEYVAERHDLAHGIYAGVVTRENNEQYPAGIVIGPNETNGLPKLEAHLIGFEGDLYGEKLVFEIHDFVRPFQEYKTIERLKEAIEADIIQIKKKNLCSPAS